MKISKIDSSIKSKSQVQQQPSTQKTNKAAKANNLSFGKGKGGSSGKGKRSSSAGSNRFIALLPVNVLSSMSKVEAANLIDKASAAF